MAGDYALIYIQATKSFLEYCFWQIYEQTILISISDPKANRKLALFQLKINIHPPINVHLPIFFFLSFELFRLSTCFSFIFKVTLSLLFAILNDTIFLQITFPAHFVDSSSINIFSIVLGWSLEFLSEKCHLFCLCWKTPLITRSQLTLMCIKTHYKKPYSWYISSIFSFQTICYMRLARWSSQLSIQEEKRKAKFLGMCFSPSLS